MKTPAWQRAAGKNPRGGLNAKGRASYKAETGGTLKAPVKGAPTTPDQLRRKGSFLTRMGSMPGLLADEQGDKTRLKLSLEPSIGYRLILRCSCCEIPISLCGL